MAIIRFTNTKDQEELRVKAADRDLWQNLVDKIGGAPGKVDDSDDSSKEAND